MAAKFSIYERKRAGKPSAFYARFRSEAGTIGSVVNSKKNTRKDAEFWAI